MCLHMVVFFHGTQKIPQILEFLLRLLNYCGNHFKHQFLSHYLAVFTMLFLNFFYVLRTSNLVSIFHKGTSATLETQGSGDRDSHLESKFMLLQYVSDPQWLTVALA